MHREWRPTSRLHLISVSIASRRDLRSPRALQGRGRRCAPSTFGLVRERMRGFSRALLSLTESRFRSRYPSTVTSPLPSSLSATSRARFSRSSDLPVRDRVTPFHAASWSALHIDRGRTTISYCDLARPHSVSHRRSSARGRALPTARNKGRCVCAFHRVSAPYAVCLTCYGGGSSAKPGFFSRTGRLCWFSTRTIPSPRRAEPRRASTPRSLTGSALAWGSLARGRCRVVPALEPGTRGPYAPSLRALASDRVAPQRAAPR